MYPIPVPVLKVWGKTCMKLRENTEANLRGQKQTCTQGSKGAASSLDFNWIKIKEMDSKLEIQLEKHADVELLDKWEKSIEDSTNFPRDYTETSIWDKITS